eukprot:CAMPEP_0168730070 /NCGR_PEP_ID=MMETSP0724-20121128/6545_1 /TAXON_ID=265536 /ORGANISM="Amphiprora sp., Strain CCMP467" /LENGTH=123 /DNA_ID=CAMNT_0008777005 /DNA_START=101 /DNA_END=472 /DNA_ORIENTATION=+
MKKNTTNGINGPITIHKMPGPSPYSSDKEFKIQWGSIASILVSIAGIFLNVHVVGGPEFKDAVGLMGQYTTGAMLDRQGNPMNSTDFVAFGMEWQVKPDLGDPQIFSTVEGRNGLSSSAACQK